jgi:hypothetical protein
MNDIQERVKSIFPSVHLTLTSVIQASVLGYSFTIANDLLSGLQWRTGLLALNSFLIIGLVWNEYAMGASAFRWIPSLRDAFLPLLIGVWQFMMVRSITQCGSLWFIWMSCLAFTSCLDVAGMHRSARHHPENEGVFRALGPWLSISEFYLLFCGVASLLAAWLDSRIDAHRGGSPLAPAMATMVIVVYLVRTWYYWRRIVRSNVRPQPGRVRH